MLTSVTERYFMDRAACKLDWLDLPSSQSELIHLLANADDSTRVIVSNFFDLLQVTHGLEYPVVRIAPDGSIQFFNWVFLDFAEADEDLTVPIRREPQLYARRYVGEQLSDFLVPEDKEILEQLKTAARERYNRLFQTSRRLGVTDEVTFLGAHGTRTPCRITVTYSRTYDAFQVAFADITDLRAAQQKLRAAHDELEERVEERTAELARANERLKREVLARRRAEEELRHVLNLVPNYIWAKDKEGRFVLVNHAVAEDYGKTPEELIGTRYEDHDKSHHRIDRPLSKQYEEMQSEVPTQRPVKYSTYPDGSPRTSRITQIPYVPPGSDEPVTLSVATDTTELDNTIAIIHGLEYPILKLSEDNRLLFLNNVFLEFAELDDADNLKGTRLDIARDKQIGTDFTTFFPEEEHASWERLKQEAKTKRLSGKHGFMIGVEGEFTFITRKHQRIPARISITYAKNFNTYQITIENITTLKQSQTALAHSEQLYRSTINAMTDLIHVVDRDLKFTLYNNPFWEYFQSFAPTDNVIGMDLFEAFPFLSEESLREEYLRVFETAQIMNTQEKHVLHNKRVVLDITKIPVLEEGIVRRVVTVIRDITQLRESEEALQRSEKMYRDTMDSFPDMLYVTDCDLRIQLFNAPVANFIAGMGRDPDSLHGQNFFDAFPFITDPDRLAEIIKQFDTVIRTQEPMVTNERHEVDGKEIDLEVRKIPIIQNNVVEQIVSIVRDTTHEKLLTERVQQAQKVESLGVLAGGVAHDFNNILMGILGYAGLAREELPEDSPLLDYVTQIENGSHRAADLTRQMLAYSGKGQLTTKPVNVTELVNGIVNLLRVTFSKKVSLELKLAPDLPSVTGDTTQLQQVIMNLITNASEAVGDHAGSVRVNTGTQFCDETFLLETYATEQLAVGEYVYVDVIDTGCGMTEETQKRIFDPFFSTKFTGRGLGLAAVLGIVKGHGGTIKVTSTPGEGSRFRVLLPVGTASTASDHVAQQNSHWHGHGVVLLVDDEDMVRNVSRTMLERSGFSVITAVDGAEGIEKFTTHIDMVDLVVLDMAMPRMNGTEVLSVIRATRPDVPVLLATGYAEQDTHVDISNDPHSVFIQKPYQKNTLVETIRTILSRYKE